MYKNIHQCTILINISKVNINIIYKEVTNNTMFETLKAKYHEFMDGERGLAQAVDIVMALIAIVVIGAIGIFIADRTVTATGTPAQANLSAMQTAILGAGQTGSQFIVILIIAFIGGVAISYLLGMWGRKVA